MKIYLVQPMRERSREEILADRELGMKATRVYYPNAEFLPNYFEDYDESVSPVEYLARSCALMAQADLVVFLPFYFGQPGCDLENHIAEIYHIPRLIINFNIDTDGGYPETMPPPDRGDDWKWC